MHPSWGMVAEPFLFMIDGNCGGLAGILEMLAGVTGERVVLAPALPEQFTTGSIRGLHLPGIAKCDLWWKDGVLESAEITLGCLGKILLEGTFVPAQPAANMEFRHEDGCTEITGTSGKAVKILPVAEAYT